MHACDRQTDRILIAIPRLHYMQRGKNSIFIDEYTTMVEKLDLLLSDQNTDRQTYRVQTYTHTHTHTDNHRTSANKTNQRRVWRLRPRWNSRQARWWQTWWHVNYPMSLAFISSFCTHTQHLLVLLPPSTLLLLQSNCTGTLTFFHSRRSSKSFTARITIHCQEYTVPYNLIL